MGRPTKYHAGVPDIVRDYVKNHEEHGDTVPTVEGLADVLDLHRDTIFTWVKDEDKKDFSDALESLRRKQKNILIQKGLVGDYNSVMAKLMLSTHGLIERTAQEVSGPDGGPVAVTQTKIVLVDPDD